MEASDSTEKQLPRWAVLALLLGLYLTLRGHESRVGDQAYRLPLVLHRQNPALYQADPFVRAFDTFNPHAGLVTLIDLTSRPFGLSAGLFGLYLALFFLTFRGVTRLSSGIWPGLGPGVGTVGFGLFLLTFAGNIGTNHLFGPMFLDRLLALALGWNALAAIQARPTRGVWEAPLWIAAAAWIHPAMGLQLGTLLIGAWIAWGLLGRRTAIPPKLAALAVGLLLLALAPKLAGLPEQGRTLMQGLPPSQMRIWAALVQSPQHLMPHLWRLPQWLAFGCFPVLAMLSLTRWKEAPSPEATPARWRLALLLGVNLLGLGLAWVLVEPLQHLKVTLFQPFRLATVARGLCLILASGHLVQLWQRGDWVGRARVVLLAVGLTNDWSLVVATSVELAATLGDRYSTRLESILAAPSLIMGLIFLSRHDTASGHVALLASLLALLAWQTWRGDRPWVWYPARLARGLAAVWIVPLAALGVALMPETTRQRFGPLAAVLVDHCRFAETPRDDIERLALWCRTHTPSNALFIGPPGPKTFRLWSHRAVAFNRAASPYHAAGLADWSARFQRHVGFDGPPAAFAAAYLTGRQELEKGYERLWPAGIATLAADQGASYILAERDPDTDRLAAVGLESLRVEGAYAIYRVIPTIRTEPATREPAPPRPIIARPPS